MAICPTNRLACMSGQRIVHLLGYTRLTAQSFERVSERMEHDLPVADTAPLSAAQIAREPFSPIPASTTVMIGFQLWEKPFLLRLPRLFPILVETGTHQLGVQRNYPLKGKTGTDPEVSP